MKCMRLYVYVFHEFLCLCICLSVGLSEGARQCLFPSITFNVRNTPHYLLLYAQRIVAMTFKE